MAGKAFLGLGAQAFLLIDNSPSAVPWELHFLQNLMAHYIGLVSHSQSERMWNMYA